MFPALPFDSAEADLGEGLGDLVLWISVLREHAVYRGQGGHHAHSTTVSTGAVRQWR